MVTSRISVVILSLKDVFPKRSMFVKFGKIILDTWGSITLRLLTTVFHL